MAHAVLVVDDDPAVARALRAALPDHVEVASAADATTATTMLDERRYCGLILDLVLLGSDGFDVLRHLESKAQLIPTVVVSERLPLYVREMLDENQVKLVFPKPIEARLLASIVMAMCEIG